MSAPHREWTVLPHERLTAVDDNILTVVGHIKMPVGDLPRRMTAVRLRDGRLVIFSAISLSEPEMHDLEDFGIPAFLIVPNDHHRLDAKAWKDRYPHLTVVTPAGARDKVAAVVEVDATDIDFEDPQVQFVTVPGTRGHEAALEVTDPAGLTLVLNDVIANIRDPHGFGGWLLKLMGFAGDEPHVPAPVKAAMVKNKAELAAQLRRWADAPSLRRIIVSHGDIIDQGPAAVLRTLAATLDQ